MTLHLILDSCFATTELLRDYHVPIYLSEILGFYHKQKTWCHQQNYMLPYNQLEKINLLNNYQREGGLKLIPVIT